MMLPLDLTNQAATKCRRSSDQEVRSSNSVTSNDEIDMAIPDYESRGCGSPHEVPGSAQQRTLADEVFTSMSSSNSSPLAKFPTQSQPTTFTFPPTASHTHLPIMSQTQQFLQPFLLNQALLQRNTTSGDVGLNHQQVHPPLPRDSPFGPSPDSNSSPFLNPTSSPGVISAPYTNTPSLQPTNAATASPDFAQASLMSNLLQYYALIEAASKQQNTTSADLFNLPSWEYIIQFIKAVKELPIDNSYVIGLVDVYKTFVLACKTSPEYTRLMSYMQDIRRLCFDTIVATSKALTTDEDQGLKSEMSAEMVSCPDATSPTTSVNSQQSDETTSDYQHGANQNQFSPRFANSALPPKKSPLRSRLLQ